MIHWLRFFFFGFGALFTLYVVLQVAAALKLSGGWRLVSLVPVPIMSFVVVKMVVDYLGESNLWPVLLIFSSPVAAVYVGLVWLVGARETPPRCGG